VISGAIAGLGGVVIVLGVYSRYITDFSPGYGWDGITVAILAGNNPILLFLSAGFFGMLRAAAISMNFGKTLSDFCPSRHYHLFRCCTPSVENSFFGVQERKE
jgi:ABC-type uncharacterized transport system permease subunit